MFSFRDEFGQWDPKNQRPELWNLYNTRIRRGEHIRVFPLSNWTSSTCGITSSGSSWRFGHLLRAPAPVFERDGILLADSEYVTRGDDEPLFETTVRYRTVGDMSCTGRGVGRGDDPRVITEIGRPGSPSGADSRGRPHQRGRDGGRKREGYF